MKTYSVIVNSRRAAQMLGEASHIVQVSAEANVKSRAAFARALIAAGLIYGSEGSVTRYISLYGGNGRPSETTDPEGQVYVTPTLAHRDSRRIAWPPTEPTDDEETK